MLILMLMPKWFYVLCLALFFWDFFSSQHAHMLFALFYDAAWKVIYIKQQEIKDLVAVSDKLFWTCVFHFDFC